MRRWMIAAALMALPVESWAGTLECQFTEPFFSISFDSRTGTVTEISADVTDPDTGKPIPRILAEGARLRIVNPDGDGLTLRLEKGDQWIMQLRLTGQGSDGMSESIYPFEATLGRNIGGCDTGKYPAFRTYDMLEDLGASL